MRSFALAGWPRSFIVIAVFLFAWQGIFSLGWVKETVVPSPGQLIEVVREEGMRDLLLQDLAQTLKRVLPGLVLGLTSGWVVGLLTGRVGVLAAVLGPILHMWRALPAVALIPLFIQFLGIGEMSKIVIVWIGTFFPVWVATHEGASGVRPDYIELADNLRFTRSEFLIRIVWPSTLPYAIAGARTGIGIAFTMIFVAEWVGADSGIGYRISLAHIVSRMDLMVLGLVELGLLAYISDASFKWASGSVFPWLRLERA